MKGNLLERTVAKLAYETSKKNINQICTGWFYQPVIPAKVKQLKKPIK